MIPTLLYVSSRFSSHSSASPSPHFSSGASADFPFAGRKYEWSLLENELKAHRSRLVVIYGRRRVGKSRQKLKNARADS